MRIYCLSILSVFLSSDEKGIRWYAVCFKCYRKFQIVWTCRPSKVIGVRFELSCNLWAFVPLFRWLIFRFLRRSFHVPKCFSRNPVGMQCFVVHCTVGRSRALFLYKHVNSCWWDPRKGFSPKLLYLTGKSALYGWAFPGLMGINHSWIGHMPPLLLELERQRMFWEFPSPPSSGCEEMVFSTTDYESLKNCC